MKVIGDFNNVSDKIKPRRLKDGEVVEYQLLRNQPNPLKPGEVIYPAATKFRTRALIKDPGKPDPVEIGIFKAKDKDGNISTYPYWFGPSGKIGLTGGSIEDQEKFEFMELSNDNESNPHRDPREPALFKRIDEVKDAKKFNGRRSTKLNALTYAESMDDAQKKEFAAAMGWDETAELEIIINQIGEFAEKRPEEFINFIEAPDLKNKAIIKYALSKGILKYDVSTHKMLWGDSNVVIATLERQDGSNHIDAFSTWVRTAGAGSKMMSGIQNKVNALIKENSNKLAEVE